MNRRIIIMSSHIANIRGGKIFKKGVWAIFKKTLGDTLKGELFKQLPKNGKIFKKC